MVVGRFVKQAASFLLDIAIFQAGSSDVRIDALGGRISRLIWHVRIGILQCTDPMLWN